MRTWLIIVSLLLAVVTQAHAQQRRSPPGESFGRPSLHFMGGWSWPVSREGLIEYWLPGPAGYIELAIQVSRGVSLGLGLDVSGYWFNGPRFAESHPGVEMRNEPVVEISPALVGRLDLAPTKRFAPYLGASVGVARVTEAVYQEVIDSVRVTYFNLPGRWRLAAGLLGGMQYRVNRFFALELETRALYMIHDENVGWTVTLRAGMKYTF